MVSIKWCPRGVSGTTRGQNRWNCPCRVDSASAEKEANNLHEVGD